MTHEYKTFPKFFEPMLTGAKNNTRRESRGFGNDPEVGDTVEFIEVSFPDKVTTGRTSKAIVTHVQGDEDYSGQDFIVLSLSLGPTLTLTGATATHCGTCRFLRVPPHTRSLCILFDSPDSCVGHGRDSEGCLRYEKCLKHFKIPTEAP